MAKDKRTYSDRREYLIRAVAQRRRTIKLRAVQLLGGKCQLCGYNKHPGVLEFHHVDASSKSFSISGGGLSRSWLKITQELKKCVLVCANCHREIEMGITKAPQLVYRGDKKG
jgi:hypothetical protein